jgi:uncharacterized protein (TIGR03086 family)
MSPVEAYKDVQNVLSRLVGKVSEANQRNATPCSEWNVRALLNHIVNENAWIPDMFDGKTVAEVGDKHDGDLLGDDPAKAWQASSDEAVAAVSEPRAISAKVHLSFGDASGEEYINQMAVDQVIHAWDLAQGIGEKASISGELAEYCLGFLEPQAEVWRNSGAFGKKVETTGKASALTKLLALSGRNAKD